MLSAAQERQWYPEARPRVIARQCAAVRAAAVQANSLRRLFDRLDQIEATQWSAQAGDGQATMDALRHAYPPPWELALQHWFDAQTATQRSFARPSRRGADRSDLVRPGRQREGWVLHLVLDTSGSMVNELPAVLGMITAFGAGATVSRVHVL